MTPAGPHHFAIKVRDLPAAERFYRDVLGLRVVRRWPAATGDGDRSVWLGLGSDDAAGTFLALESVTGGPPRSPGGTGPPTEPTPEPPTTNAAGAGAPIGTDTAPPGHHLLALRIARTERATWEARLAAAGVEISHRTDFTLYFTDPEGNRLGLSHHPDAAAPIA